MNFAIIAAGTGERLKEEGIYLPKPLVPIKNIPLIERLLTIIDNQNPDSINIIINDEAKEVHSFIKNHRLKNKINLKVKSTQSSLHSLYELRTFLSNKPFCLFTVDTVFLESEFHKFIEFLNSAENNFDAVLGITPFIKDEKPLHVDLNKDGLITSFKDDINSSSYVTGGLYYFTDQIYKEVEFAVENNYQRLRNFLKLLIEKNYKIKGFTFSKIIDVDHIDDIRSAENFLLPEINSI
jgi:NDP-sugar pyrophosphorylase family protein